MGQPGLPGRNGTVGPQGEPGALGLKGIPGDQGEPGLPVRTTCFAYLF